MQPVLNTGLYELPLNLSVCPDRYFGQKAHRHTYTFHLSLFPSFQVGRICPKRSKGTSTLIKLHVSVFPSLYDLPVITQLLNKCLATGKMPRPFKEALVIPLLKKKNLEIQFKNFRPISNLPFLSKVLERVVIHQLSTHCERLSLNVKLKGH